MNDSKLELKSLLEKHTLSADERKRLLELLALFSPEEVKEILDTLSKDNSYPDGDVSEKMLADIYKKAGIKARPKLISMRAWRIVAAASIILFIVGYLFLTPGKKGTQGLEVIAVTSELDSILPGGNKAILTLSDGSQIVLDSTDNGNISRQGNVTVIKLADGELSYQGKNENGEKKVVYNTISTPRGGQYQLILADGTKVWLNAASTLTFPTSFPGGKREVTLEGEGYFEVKRDVNKPFFVHTSYMDVNVLGTQFNVSAYPDENVKHVTLINGSVNVDAGGREQVLRQGEQSWLNTRTDQLQKRTRIDTEEFTAWKDGYFYFNETSIQTVMRQFSKWYDIDVSYKGHIPKTRYNGKIYRDMNLQKVVDILSFTSLKIELKGKDLIVSELKNNNENKP